jgi:L-aspartate oxidase
VQAHPEILLKEDCCAIDLVTTGWMKLPGPTRCVGAYFLDGASGRVMAIRAPFTMLATGGAGKVYLYTTNPDVATGDGVAMAWRAGLPIVNMEFVQFHPTCLYHKEARSFLISEAVRGEGAELLNEAGEAFMQKHDPRGALAPRDIVARAIDYEIKKRGDTCVYLDITHKTEDQLRKRFPNIYATLETLGYRMERDRIPVVPAAHYFCGGVRAGIDGVTELPGLYACGEVACTGMHGANRLASNSLLEARVCAVNAARHMVGHRHRADIEDIRIPDWQRGNAMPSNEAVVVEHNWNEVRNSMWDYVGIVRTNKRLERAYRRIRNLRREIREYYRDYLVSPDLLELRNLADVAELVIRCAFLRSESRGLHYTLDYLETNQADPVRNTVISDPPGGTLLL